MLTRVSLPTVLSSFYEGENILAYRGAQCMLTGINKQEVKGLVFSQQIKFRITMHDIQCHILATRLTVSTLN